jgi:hypothetical protein
MATPHEGSPEENPRIPYAGEDEYYNWVVESPNWSPPSHPTEVPSVPSPSMSAMPPRSVSQLPTCTEWETVHGEHGGMANVMYCEGEVVVHVEATNSTYCYGALRILFEEHGFCHANPRSYIVTKAVPGYDEAVCVIDAVFASKTLKYAF